MSGVRKRIVPPVYVGGNSRYTDKQVDPACRQQGHVYNAIQVFHVKRDDHSESGDVFGTIKTPMDVDKRPFCTATDWKKLEEEGGGRWHWVRFNDSRCSESVLDELTSLAAEAVIVRTLEKVETTLIKGSGREWDHTREKESTSSDQVECGGGGGAPVVWYELYHKPSASALFAAKHQFSSGQDSYVLFSWVKPLHHMRSSMHRLLRANKVCVSFPPKASEGADMSKPSSAMMPPWQRDPTCTLGRHPVPPGALRATLNPISGDVEVTAPRKFSYDASIPRLFGYRWEPVYQQCRVKHYSRSQLRTCLGQWEFGSILFSGDSVTGGLSRILKWMLGVSNLQAEWYLKRKRGGEREVSASHVSIETNGAFNSDNNTTVTSGDRKTLSISNLRCALEDNKACIKSIVQLKHGPFLLFVNFKIHHMMALSSTTTIISNIASFFSKFQSAVDNGHVHPQSQCIFVSAMATLKFREVYCTTTRAEIISNAISDRARKTSNWIVIDAFNMTVSRPDLSHDGE